MSALQDAVNALFRDMNLNILVYNNISYTNIFSILIYLQDAVNALFRDINLLILRTYILNILLYYILVLNILVYYILVLNVLVYYILTGRRKRAVPRHKPLDSQEPSGSAKGALMHDKHCFELYG